MNPPEPLGLAHKLDGFDCGDESLNFWLRKHAWRNEASGASRCFVLCEGAAILGFYTISAAGIARDAAPKAVRRNAPNPVPALLIGRLGVDLSVQGRGLGKALLKDAMIRASVIAKNAGVALVFLHALSETAKRFYLSRGFVESPLQPMTMCMTMATIASILSEED